MALVRLSSIVKMITLIRINKIKLGFGRSESVKYGKIFEEHS